MGDSFGSERDSATDNPKQVKTFASTAKSLTSGDRKQAIAQISAAAGAAQQWGWGVLNKRKQQREGAPREASELRPEVPIGRGHPLPPPGMPLPPPARSSTMSLGGLVPKRKPLPPPLLPKRNQVNDQAETQIPGPSPRPQLPERRQRKSLQNGEAPVEEVLIAAPTESAPTSPNAEEHHDDFFGHGEGDLGPSLPQPSHGDEDMPEAEAALQDSQDMGHNVWAQALKDGERDD